MAPKDSLRRFGLNCSETFTSVDNTGAPDFNDQLPSYSVARYPVDAFISIVSHAFVDIRPFRQSHSVSLKVSNHARPRTKISNDPNNANRLKVMTDFLQQL